MTKTEKACALLTESELSVVKQVIHSTFFSIAPDLIDLEDDKSSIKQADAIEATLDADFMETNSSKDKEVLKKFRTLSYDDQKLIAKTVLTSKSYRM